MLINNQLHAVSRTQHGRQREPSVNTLRFLFSAEFWRYCVCAAGAQRHTLPRHQSKEMKILNILLTRGGMEPTNSVYSNTFVPLRHDWPP